MSSSFLSLNVPELAAGFDLLASGTEAFDRILRRISEARRTILIRCFDWRDDETGQSVAKALLDAADRGVSITILKDRVGMHYEYLEAKKQSFFHKDIALIPRLQTWLLMAAYGRWGSLKQTASPLAAALLAHPNVRVHCDKKRFDHAKLYVFDDETVILGGMGIGDDFRLHNVDFMVEISGADAAKRLADRYAGRASFDAARPFDYLLHSFIAGEREVGSLARQRLKLINGARERLTIEMAYFGEPTCTEALIAAVRRGVSVTILTSERANIIGDLNLFSCDTVLRQTRNADNLRVVLHPRMVHGKAIVADGRHVDIGSANFTPLSHGGYEEVDLYCRDARLARDIEAAIERDIQDGRQVHSPVPYRRVHMMVEKAITVYQSRRPGKMPPAQFPGS